MSSSTPSRAALEVFSEWFAEYTRLAYWLANEWVRRLSCRQGITLAASEREELVQDAVARGYDRFVKRCTAKIPAKLDRKKWVCQCMLRAVRDALRSKSRFGSVTQPAAIRDDAMNRYRRVRPEGRHGTPEEREYLDPQDKPVAYEPTAEEVLAVIERELPPKLHDTARFAAFGISQVDSAKLQGVTDRTVRNRLGEIRLILDGFAPNDYAVIVAACEEYLRGPRAYTTA
jgi:DNA-directed RNA polymerase specialized sigma24 family protein